jgi:hypothetical protein
VLADPQGELRALAEELNSVSITSLVFMSRANLGELTSLAHAVDATHRFRKQRQSSTATAPDWSEWAATHGVEGIRINIPLEARRDAVLANFVTALLELESANQPLNESSNEPGNEPGNERGNEFAKRGASAVQEITREQVRRTLHFLSQAGRRLNEAQHDSPQESGRTVQAELAAADPQALAQSARRLAANPPQEGDSPGPYLSRIGDEMSSDFVRNEYTRRRIRASEIRLLFEQLYRSGEHENEPELLFEARIERFWTALPAREISRMLESGEGWCIPVSALRKHLESLLVTSDTQRPDTRGDAARLALRNFLGCLDSEEDKARRAVAAALIEISDLLERLWPHPQLQDLAPKVVAALVKESSPGIAGLLVAATENLARVGWRRRGYAEIERILDDLDKGPREPEHGYIAALARRIIAQDQWLTLVDESLENRPLDPTLPRLLRREPQRLVDRLGLLMTAPGGSNTFPAMARLVRAAGEPVIGTLETQLSDPRRQRQATAIKLLSAVQPERLATALPRVLPGWEWSLQDLAVSELSRQPNAELRKQAARIFLSILNEAHLFVVPSMIDQIALAGDTSAIPQLWAVAAGDVEQLRDMFIRIKAVEALGRMRATEAADLLRNMVRQRDGIAYTEPAGLRAAAEEALALMEAHPDSERLRAMQDAVNKASGAFSVQRRYLRVQLPDPVTAKIAAPHEGTARVHSIALGGALLETDMHLAVGDSIRAEMRIGLRSIALTAVVRNVSIAGYGIEFMHMKPEDREKLRRHISKLLS